MEKYLIEHCSPTLASIKTGNLFNIDKREVDNIQEEIKKFNMTLNHKDIFLKIMKEKEDRALIYVYRKRKLERDWDKKNIQGFMNMMGYDTCDIDKSVDILADKLSKQMEFPHEIGMFLGYPFEDVLGFIKNKGRNSKCTGCWKVYCNECQAIKTFNRFDKCRRLYKEMWKKGKDVTQLAVAM